MAGKSTALLGIYPNYSGAMSAVNVLTEAGFRKTEMRIGALTIPDLGPFAAAGGKSSQIPTRSRRSSFLF